MTEKRTEEVPSQVKRPIRLLDVRSDVVFKKIFGQHPKLIKSFLNGILPLPEGHLIESVTYLTPEQSPRIPSMKNTIVDVKCTDQTGRIFITEMQMAWRASFMKRFLFGASKAFVQQLEAGQAYETLCPVYGVAIVNETFEKNMEDWFHHYRLTNVKDLDKSLEGLELIFIELQKFRPQTFEHRKIGALWLRFLKEANETLLSIPQEFQDNPDLAMAVELAQESAYTPMELELYDQYLDALRVEQTVRADSYVEGRAEGEQVGLEKGEQIGLQKGKQIWGDKKAQEIAKELIVAGIPIETVSKATKLSPDVVAKLTREISRE